MTPKTDAGAVVDVAVIRLAIADRLAKVSHRRDKSKLVAATLFFEHGTYPSASIVRSVTEHGSLTDIQADLRLFWQELRSTASKSASIPGIPESLAGIVGPAIQSLWETAVAAANDSVLDVKREVELSAFSANEAAAADRARLDEARAHIQAQALLLEQGRAALLDSQREVAALNQQVSAHHQALAELHASLEAAHLARADLQSLLAGGLDSLRKSTDKASDAFRGEINFLKMQVDAARSAERDLREQLQSARQGRELELQVMRQQNNGLLESNGRLTLMNQELLQKLGVIAK